MRQLWGFCQATAASDLMWPQLPKLSPRHWSAFWWCLHATFCTTASTYDQSANYKLWFIKLRYVLYDRYRSESTVFWPDDHGCCKCDADKQQNYYGISRDNISEPPLFSHLVSYQSLPGGRLWVWKNYFPQSFPTKTNMKTLIQDDFSEHSGEKLTIVSNASVHLNNDTTLGAYQLHTIRDKKRWVSQPLEPQTHSHSYCHWLKNVSPCPQRYSRTTHKAPSYLATYGLCGSNKGPGQTIIQTWPQHGHRCWHDNGTCAA